MLHDGRDITAQSTELQYYNLGDNVKKSTTE
jgi:hypothetical protein